ncbi:MAG: asparagine synthase (glutamine-hydrolyzing) [Bacteroidetes bacterium]|nr:asparagine synthase (glutamine-hydrolyzing) [Bacteroidota bacterium]
MCGIAGIISPYASEFQPQIEKMITSLRHRGPDADGMEIFPECILGHTRLSVIDIENGKQPMLSANGKKAITFNGEIYGYKELKSQLPYPYKTESDTEVILALHQKYGTEMFQYLTGMFAFGLWNDDEKELMLARDIFGEKPLYYAYGEHGTFIFASEIKAILATGLVTPKLSIPAVAHYLKRLYVHPSTTIYDNIHVLPPAHYLVYKEGKIQLKKYWEMPSGYLEISASEAYEKFEYLFTESIKKQLVSDVDLGIFLSGGMDSSSITAVASQLNPKIKTYSFGFENAVNELPFAQLVANKFQTQHTTFSDAEIDVASLLLKMNEVYDEPFADSSCIPTFLLSQHASSQIKVVLSGDGGDELLGGYSWYQELLPSAESQNIKTLFSGLLNKKSASDFTEKHHQQNIWFAENGIKNLGINALGFDVIHPDFKTDNTIKDAQKMDLQNYMAGDILVKTDRAAMANGLEIRTPFLDRNFAEFCLQLPNTFIIEKGKDKKILRGVFKHKLPPQILARPKQGFGAPVKEWLKRKPVAELKNNYLLASNLKINSILNKEKVAEIAGWDNYKTWQLLVLSLWMEKNI